MITYNRSAFGLNLIFQVHGSAVYRAVFPSLISVAIFFLWQRFYNAPKFDYGENLGHPYAIGALVASSSFLVVFRANQGYARYWEGCGSVHHMMGKWLDSTVHAGVYHLQCDHYKDIKPPSYFDYPELNNLYLTRDRERGVNYEDEDEEDEDEEADDLDNDDDDDDDHDSKIQSPHSNNNNNNNNNHNHNHNSESSLLNNFRQPKPQQGRFSSSNLTRTTSNSTTRNTSNSTTRNNNNTKQQQEASLHHHRRGDRKLVIHEEKEKRRQQAVVKSINFVVHSNSSHSTSPTIMRRRNNNHNRASSSSQHLSSDSSLPPLDGGGKHHHHHPRRNNNKASTVHVSSSDSSLPPMVLDDGDDGDNNNNNSPHPALRSSRSMDDIHSLDIDNNNNKNNNNDTLSQHEFFELLQKEVAQGAPSHSQPGKGKPYPLWGRPRLDGGWGALYNTTTENQKNENENTENTSQEEEDTRDTNKGNKKRTTTTTTTTRTPTPLATFAATNDDHDHDHNVNSKLPPKGFASIRGGRTPPLYLQELAHLSSLLVAVALSTLRNDLDGCESPLAFYEPGSDWPTVDPDKDDWMKASSGFTALRKSFLLFLGMGRSPTEQTRYNAGRPLPVLGGVSDAEIRFLQMARGPYAKTQLCWNWLSEFMMREHLAGSMGKVGPPIVSRCIQFLGDGMIYYNHARKIMFVPFPFVHAQLSVLFIVVLIPIIPFLMVQWTGESWLGAVLTFFTVLCLAGVNEVARELENPFRNVPNELPLVTFMAQYNEALITMYAGYHPDFFWNGKAILRQRQQQQQEAANDSNSNSRNPPRTTSGGSSEKEEEEPDLCSGQQQRRHQRHMSSTPEEPGITTTSSTDEADDSSQTLLSSTTTTTERDEIALLKEQVAKQAKLIEQLFAQMGPVDPQEATKHLEESTIVC
jgi:predicted membrane chloride channel (bestrophin family)